MTLVSTQAAPEPSHRSGAILAIDTSTEACSAALWLPSESLPRLREAEVPRAQAEWILPMVEDLLEEAGLRLEELAAIAFARGPGSFTGVRLAASVTQGLAYGASLPVIPISTLAAVAAAVFARDAEATHTLVCNDARMGEVYWAIFDRELNLGAGGEQVSPPATVSQSVERYAEFRWALAGRGLAAYPEIAHAWQTTGRVTSLDDRRLPSAREVALLGQAALAAGQTVSPHEAIPVYVRDRVTHGEPRGLR